jgi:ATP-dependent Clp protease protease subunit
MDKVNLEDTLRSFDAGEEDHSMTEPTRVANTVAIWMLVVCAFLFLSVHAVSLIWMIRTVNEVPTAGELIETVVDYQFDNGIAEPVLSPDDPLLAARKVLLTTGVNQRIARDVTARLLLLDRIDPDSPIDLYLSTPGGWEDGLFTIIDAMYLIDAPVNTWAIGGCYSAGALILAAGTGTRYATTNSIIMVHTSFDDSEEPYSYDRLSLARYEEMWKSTADIPEEWFPMTSYDAYYLTPEEAKEMGLVDEIVMTSGAGEGHAP